MTVAYDGSGEDGFFLRPIKIPQTDPHTMQMHGNAKCTERIERTENNWVGFFSSVTQNKPDRLGLQGPVLLLSNFC